jgi:hypothetical protein
MAKGTRIDGLTQKFCEVFPSVKIYTNMTITYPDHRVRERSAKGSPLDAKSAAAGVLEGRIEGLRRTEKPG